LPVPFLFGLPAPPQTERVTADRPRDRAERTIARMTAHYRDPALEPANRPFALLYLRTTEGMRDANAAGEFSDPPLWADRVIPAFAAYYLDAYAAWKRADGGEVAPAWRIAFETAPGSVTCTQQIFLGINAHVRNDLAFLIETIGDGYTYPDHRHVDDVLAIRTRPVVYPEIERELCPGLMAETMPETADRDIVAWRRTAWTNAQRLRTAPGPAARDAVAAEIRAVAEAEAITILNWRT
jgi:hypothetical protein